MSDEIDRLLASLSPEARQALRNKLEERPVTFAPEALAPLPVDSGDFEADEPTSETWDESVEIPGRGQGERPDGPTASVAPTVMHADAEPSATFGSVDEPTAAVALPPPAAELPPDAPPPPRYTELAVLGEGGMGMVLRVLDRELNRPVAMKVLKPKLVSSPRALTRFREEAQIAAQLQHPGIIPVHDIGRRPDGSVYFTMKEVRGQTYEDVIDEVQIALEEGRQRTESGWSFRRLVDTFHRVCETVAYAHHRGVVHRDLKPENIMVGGFGEVLVLDWGLAKVLAEEQSESDEGGVITDRSASDESLKTRMGAVAGTPSYMAPEQARGQIHKIDATSDVYGLGGILYALLAGRTPYMARTVREMLDMVSEGEPITPPHRLKQTPGPVPVELSEIAMKALSHKQKDRYPHAGALAEEVATWLDGARKREKALEVVAEARQAAATVPELRATADALEAEAARVAATLRPGATEEERWPVWDLELEAERSRDQAERVELEVVQGLRSALSHAPELPEAHDALAERFHAAHVKAEAAGDAAAARRVEPELRAHNRAGRYDRYLKGDGAVTLITDPPGAVVRLYEYQEHHKRMVPVFREILGETPIVERTLPRGTWLLEAEKPGHHTVRYPVHIDRLQHWDGVPPDETAPEPIPLPRLGELAEDDCYVPAGWFWSGGAHPAVQNPLPWRRLWCHGMVFKRFQVTVGEMLEAANRMVREGREEEALRMVPRENGPNDEGALIFGRTADGLFALVPDKDGDLWHTRWPVPLVNVRASSVYLEDLASRTGQSWRLPHELEWEKAARGVAGWHYPWGHRPEARFACVLGVNSARPVEDFPQDESLYGLRGCAGGMEDWTCDPAPAGTPVAGRRLVPTASVADDAIAICCGGAWSFSVAMARLDYRKGNSSRLRASYISARGCRPWDARKKIEGP